MESPGSDRLRSRWTWQPQVPVLSPPRGWPRQQAQTTLTQMMRLSHSGSSGWGSGCGSSMVREPRRRALGDGRTSAPGPRQRPTRPPPGARPSGLAPAPLTREASRRRRRRGATAPLAHRVRPVPRHLSQPRPPIAHRALSDLGEHQSQRSWAPARPAGREERE